MGEALGTLFFPDLDSSTLKECDDFTDLDHLVVTDWSCVQLPRVHCSFQERDVYPEHASCALNARKGLVDIGFCPRSCRNLGSAATIDTPPISSDGGVEALQIDGVWVFEHQPEIAGDALHSGTPEIVDGCLVVDNTTVVWHVDRIDEAAEAIAAVKAGESPQLLIGGGGISVDEGASPDQIPTVITDRCPTTAVWFGAP